MQGWKKIRKCVEEGGKGVKTEGRRGSQLCFGASWGWWESQDVGKQCPASQQGLMWVLKRNKWCSTGLNSGSCCSSKEVMDAQLFLVPNSQVRAESFFFFFQAAFSPPIHMDFILSEPVFMQERFLNYWENHTDRINWAKTPPAFCVVGSGIYVLQPPSSKMYHSGTVKKTNGCWLVRTARDWWKASANSRRCVQRPWSVVSGHSWCAVGCLVAFFLPSPSFWEATVVKSRKTLSLLLIQSF